MPFFFLILEQTLNSKKMLIIISPAKTLNFNIEAETNISSEPEFSGFANQLVEILRNYSSQDLEKLMGISRNLAELNFERFYKWQQNPNREVQKQAVLAFNGEVYNGLKVRTFTNNDFLFAQKHLRILSGLYGVLKPMDFIQPYRLEMGTKLPNWKGNNLYEFWENMITQKLISDMEENNCNTLLNLASAEYFGAVNKKLFSKQIISPEFKDEKNGQYKIISVYAKKARGLMANFLIKNKITNYEDIKAFQEEGYIYSAKHSKPNSPVFIR